MQRRRHCWQRRLLMALSCAFLFSTLRTHAQDASSSAASAEPVTISAAADTDTADNPRISCRVHVVNNTASPTTFSHVQSSLKINAAADVMDMSVILQVQHPKVADLEITLAAASVAGDSAKAVLKAPAAGVSGGANMVQTIFSDYAPNVLSMDESAAPYSSTFRPAQSFRALVSGNGTLAGAGGSQGIWTMAVTDKGTGDLSRRPLKLTGWELWLCGESTGPLFAQAADGAADSSSDVTVVKKAVPAAAQLDVDVMIKAGYRMEQVEMDLVNQAINKVNTYLAQQLATEFSDINGRLGAVRNTQLAGFLKGALGDTLKSLQQLPGSMGYIKLPDGAWSLPTSEVVIKSFLDTLVHCYHDLYWCWENTGLQGNFALDFASTWDELAGGASAGWAATQEQWLGALTRFGEAYPNLNGFSDYLFGSVIDMLYGAAALDAAATVGQAYLDTAIRLAVYASPLRFTVNPRAFFTLALEITSEALNIPFLALSYIPDLVDGDNNNDVAAITGFVDDLIRMAQNTMGVLTEGVLAQSQGIQARLMATAGGMARSAAGLSENVGQSLQATNPTIAAAYEAMAAPMQKMLQDIAQTQQSTLQQYFKSQRSTSTLYQELARSNELLGDVARKLAKNGAEAFEAAQAAIDDAMPGPSVEKVLADLGHTIQGILSDARDQIEAVLPLPELAEMSDLLAATLESIMEILQESAIQVQTSEGAAAIRANLQRLAERLGKAGQEVAGNVAGMLQSGPGPLLNGTMAVIQRQASQTGVEIRNTFDRLVKDFPNLDPKTTIDTLTRTLNSFLDSMLGQVNVFDSIASFDASKALSEALPGLTSTVTQAAKDAQNVATLAFPASMVGDQNQQKAIKELEQGVADALNRFANQVDAIARSISNQPALSEITADLSTRSSQLASSSNDLLPAIAEFSPSKIAEAAVNDFNNGLSLLLSDLESQSQRAPELAKLLAEGPLGAIAADVGSVAKGLAKDVNGAIEGLAALLPPLPPLPNATSTAQQLQSMLGPQLKAVDAILSQTAQAAVNAAAAARKGAVGGVAQVVEGLTQLLIDSQTQVAGLIDGAVTAVDDLQTRVANITDALAPPMKLLDQNLKQLSDALVIQFESNLKALTPPPEVLDGVVRPLASALNDQLGNVSTILARAPQLGQGLSAALQQLQQVADGMVPAVAGALAPPGDVPTAGPQPPKLGAAGEAASKPATAGSNEPKGTSGAARQGRGLLQDTTAAEPLPLPNFAVMFASIPDVTALRDADGSAFDAAAFRGQLAKQLQKVFQGFADQLVGTVLGAPGVSGQAGVVEVILGLSKNVGEAVKKLEGVADRLPHGPVLAAIMGADKGSISSLLQLQQGIVRAMDGGNSSTIDVNEISNLIRSAGNTLQSLSGGPGYGAVREQTMQLVEQFADNIKPLPEVATGLLQAFSQRMSSVFSDMLAGQ